MLAVVKLAVDVIFSFSNTAHDARNTVQLMQCKTLNFLRNCGPTRPKLNSNDYIARFVEIC